MLLGPLGTPMEPSTLNHRTTNTEHTQNCHTCTQNMHCAHNTQHKYTPLSQHKTYMQHTLLHTTCIHTTHTIQKHIHTAHTLHAHAYTSIFLGLDGISCVSVYVHHCLSCCWVSTKHSVAPFSILPIRTYQYIGKLPLPEPSPGRTV